MRTRTQSHTHNTQYERCNRDLTAVEQEELEKEQLWKAAEAEVQTSFIALYVISLVATLSFHSNSPLIQIIPLVAPTVCVGVQAHRRWKAPHPPIW